MLLLIPRFFDPQRLSNERLDNLTHSLLIGCVLVIVVLCFFLFDWRAALISSLAIPSH
ncbi:MAG: efflux RND transporter permease subunit [Planctomycetaceae bacterium]